MTRRMLIDAVHPEETRVTVVSHKHLEEFDFESASRKQVKGNLYLAKITRVEPSLQAAFVDYGGNRHGFLPFPEIHPDYYRIPIEDREALLAEEQALIDAEHAENDESDDEQDDAETTYEDDDSEAIEEAASDDAEKSEDESDDSEDDAESAQDETSEKKGKGRRGNKNRTDHPHKDKGDNEGGSMIFKLRAKIRRKYKIQEVIKRGQILLVQVTKEERGNKGAALTSYVSLPGRYSVLMPNSPRGGGVSRKISNYKDRKRMKQVLADMKVPSGMSVIMRTAGIQRTKAEIKRDLDYLYRLWDSIRGETLKSTAPDVVYEESDLIKQAIRDLYDRDIEEVLVAGDDAYKQAKNFMKMMIPSHAKKVQLYKDENVPLFHRYDVERQINAIHDSNVPLKSGGYLVINPTEALISVDVNSGRATRERNIEETALKTNMEAAEELARQLRIRDLGGLVVVDFIDMEERRNNVKVERKMKEAMSGDRARVQVGRISMFGLLELSRQRLRSSFAETHFEECMHCKGTGIVRTADSMAMMIMRAIIEEVMDGRLNRLTVRMSAAASLFFLNHKRDEITQIESRYGVQIVIEIDESLGASDYTLERLRKRGAGKNQPKDGQEKPKQNKQSQNKKRPQPEKEKVEETEQKSEETGRKNNGSTPDVGDEKATKSRRSRGGQRRSKYGNRRPRRDNNSNEEGMTDNVKPDTSVPEIDGNKIASAPVEADGNTIADSKPAKKPRKATTRRASSKKKSDEAATPKTEKKAAAKPQKKAESVATANNNMETKPEPAPAIDKPVAKITADGAKPATTAKKQKKGWWGKLLD